MKYGEVYSSLQTEVCIITFLKKDATVRNMLATRNRRIANICGNFNVAQFEGHDKRCNIDNGNIAVYDLIIDEVRSFNVGRLLYIKQCGNVKTREELNAMAEQFRMFDTEYRKHNPMDLSIDMNMGMGDDNSDN